MSFSSSSVSHYLVNWFSNFCQHIVEFDPLFVQFVYFLSVSVLGFCLLLVTKPRANYVDKPSHMDLFFMSVSATTTSSMSVVEMEFFSNNQLLILTFLMFVGGDIFISIVGLQFSISKLRRKRKNETKVDEKEIADPENSKTGNVVSQIDCNHLKYNSIQFLHFVVIAYFLVSHLIGFILIPIYLTIFPSTKNVVKGKSLSPFTFVVFTTVSSFTNCGFIPTNENMTVFKKNSGLLLILIPQILLGSTLYPPCLRFSIWVVGKMVKKAEAKYLLESPSHEICYFHWLSARHSTFLVLTVFGFLLVQFAMFYSMEWNSEGLSDLDIYERIIGVLFVVVNTRYSGETILDLWKLAPAIWVFFVFLMYIPPYTSYVGTNNFHEVDRNKKRNKMVEELMFSPLSYIVIFVIIICIIERKKMEEDPNNFNALSIVIEVASAYGNVGLSKGYNCDAQLKPDSKCVGKWYGFSGKWSNEGKFILILVMLYGTLKKCHIDEGRAWKLM